MNILADKLIQMPVLNKMTAEINTYAGWKERYKSVDVDFDKLVARGMFFHVLSKEEFERLTGSAWI